MVCAFTKEQVDVKLLLEIHSIANTRPKELTA
jgi:hypothetical protein